jgi:hypothetical protein
MHAFFISCQTCHVRLDKSRETGIFKWYERTTGEIVDSPIKRSLPGMYKAKIIPFESVNGKLQRITHKRESSSLLNTKKEKKHFQIPKNQGQKN